MVKWQMVFDYTDCPSDQSTYLYTVSPQSFLYREVVTSVLVGSVNFGELRCENKVISLKLQEKKKETTSHTHVLCFNTMSSPVCKYYVYGLQILYIWLSFKYFYLPCVVLAVILTLR